MEVVDKKRFMHAFNDSVRSGGIPRDVARKVKRWVKRYTLELCATIEVEEDDFDWCYECTGYGDDYYQDENGDLVSSCPTCPHNPHREDD